MADFGDNFYLWPIGHPTPTTMAPTAPVPKDAMRNAVRSEEPSAPVGSASERAALAEWEGEGGHLAAPPSIPPTVS